MSPWPTALMLHTKALQPRNFWYVPLMNWVDSIGRRNTPNMELCVGRRFGWITEQAGRGPMHSLGALIDQGAQGRSGPHLAAGAANRV